MRDLIDAGVPVGLGGDGSASNEAGRLVDELRSAMLVARLRGGPQALTAREALRLATMGGARCLGRQSELGSLEPGKLADVAVWRLDELGQAGAADPVFCWAFSSSAPLELLLVNGRGVVAESTLLTADSGRLAREAAANASVLLKNDLVDGAPLLPLTGSFAVVGEFARTPRYQGAGSSQVNPTRLDDALIAEVQAADVIVIGLGGMGSAAAYHLAARGQRDRLEPERVLPRLNALDIGPGFPGSVAAAAE